VYKLEKNLIIEKDKITNNPHLISCLTYLNNSKLRNQYLTIMVKLHSQWLPNRIGMKTITKRIRVQFQTLKQPLYGDIFFTVHKFF